MMKGSGPDDEMFGKKKEGFGKKGKVRAQRPARTCLWKP